MQQNKDVLFKIKKTKIKFSESRNQNNAKEWYKIIHVHRHLPLKLLFFRPHGLHMFYLINFFFFPNYNDEHFFGNRSVSSAFLSCLCSTFREPINKFLEDESCLIMNITMKLNETFEKFKDIEMKKDMGSAGIYNVLNSGVLKLIDEVMDIIREPAGRIIDTITTEICR